MIYKIAALLIATVSGSLHCGLMCGGLSMAVGPSSRLQFLYQGSRLSSYLIIGLLAGGLGSGFLNRDGFHALGLIMGGVIGLYLAGSGVSILIRGRPLEFNLGWGIQSFRFAGKLGTKQRALLFGFFTPLLPCGWLYTALALAMNSGNALSGALILGAVWMGSAPILVLGPAGLKLGLSIFQNQARMAVAMLMIFAGLFSIHERLGSYFQNETQSQPGLMICH